MLNISSKDFILKVLFVLKARNIQATKIILHKFIYFLTLQNVTRIFKFEPYTYGPFSFDLAKEIESLVFWEKINVDKKDVNLVDDVEFDIDDSIFEIGKNIDIFLNITENNLSFDSLERVGTILYCIEALKRQGVHVNSEVVKNEFRGWKGNKYTDQQIERTFALVSSYFSDLLQ